MSEELSSLSFPKRQYEGLVKDLLLVFAPLVFIRVLFLSVLPESSLSVDLERWSKVAEMLSEGKNPYNESSYLNAGPFWMQFIYIFGKISSAFDISIYSVVKTFLILVECAVAAILLHTLNSWGVSGARRLLNISISFNPVCILLTCQHAQFDILVSLLILLFTLFLLRYQKTREALDWLCSTLFLGLGILAKTVPFVLLPLATYRARELTPRTILLGVFLIIFPVLLGVSVIFVLGPKAVSDNVLAYESISGYFGFTGILKIIAGENLDFESRAFANYGRVFFSVLLVSLVLGTRYLRERVCVEPRQILHLVFFYLALLPAIGTGYGPQYISWFIPILILLFPESRGADRLSYILFYVVAALTYIYEYGLFTTHGALFREILPGSQLGDLCDILSQPIHQTLARLPLFICYLFLLACSFRAIRKPVA